MQNNKSKILMVYPSFVPTYWGFQYVTPLLGRKTNMPPLGLATIAALTPPGYDFKIVDLNCEPLTDEHIAWADLVCFSAMLPQKSSLFATAKRCRDAGKMVVFGGPLPTALPEECQPHADVLVLNEGEITWPMFIADLEKGEVKPSYTTEEKPDVTQTPVPRFDLLKMNDYLCVPLQFSRGCPYLCEFCDIIVMFGRRPRTKTPEQMCAELDAVYNTGYRGQIFIVDDNFIGNKKEVKKFLLALHEWNVKRDFPFYYGTEASVNLADEAELLQLMVQAHFIWVFLGIESPVAESLKETLKVQNLKGSLVDKVETIHRAGLQVFGGFIVGFDQDPEDIFDRQIEFIEATAIANAMIGPMVALPKTPLYERMKRTGRLVEEADGDEDFEIAAGYTNIVTKIPVKDLMEGQRRILQTIYTPEAYFERQLRTLMRLPHPKGLLNRLRRASWLMFHFRVSFDGADWKAFWENWKQVPGSYWRISFKFLWQIIRNCPDQVPWWLLSIFFGYHYQRFTKDRAVPGLTARIEQAELMEEPHRISA